MTEDTVQRTAAPVDPVQAQARRRLKQKRDLAAHMLVYTMVNGFILIIWAVTSGGFFWPVFPMVGWGIGLVMNAWDVWRGGEFTEAQVSREVARIQRRAAK